MAKSSEQMEKIVSLCKRRGFIFQSSEIYGGINGFWDYGPLGVELKRNVKDAWWHDMVTNPPTGPDGKELEMVGLDAAIIMNPKVWEASGHVGGFSDPMVVCKAEGCKRLYRGDQLFACGWLPRREYEDARDALLKNPHEACNSLRSIHEGGGEVTPSAVLETVLNTTAAVHQFPNPLWKFVVASSAEDARASCELSSKEKKRLGDPVFLGSVDAVVFFYESEDQGWQPLLCPHCGQELTEPREFNLMFKTFIGATATEDDVAYLRPETAQGIFANYKNVLDSTRIKLPFGIAQIGKAFRNEINPRNYTFRSREFEQMEIEFFCKEENAMMWWEYWRDVRIKWYTDLGLAGENLRPREQTADELAHYSKVCTDIEYCFPFADEPQELEGVAHRGTYDLGKHQDASKKDLTYFDDDVWLRDKDKFPDKGDAKKAKQGLPYRFLPTVIEPSAGADRSTLAFICEAYTVDESRPSPELLKFHPRLAPIKAAIFPLVNKDGLPEIAEPIYRDVKKRWPAAMDVKASIGKRYARMDEAGTPYCFTVDGETKENGTVTVRDRDTGNQDRIDKSRVVEYLSDRL